jgi:hypothetical protein
MRQPDDGLSRLFRSPRYVEMAGRLAPVYASASPFPHIVIDDFLPDALASRILTEFPSPDAADWARLDKSAYSKKLAANREEQVGSFIYSVLTELNGADFLVFLERLTGIQGLAPDPYFEGGGLHQILPGGFLKVHADFNLHSGLRLDRRLNLLLYLNRAWCEEYGGHLELWDRKMTRCEVRVLPVFNRAVIFSTLDWSFHGHPDPLGGSLCQLGGALRRHCERGIGAVEVGVPARPGARRDAVGKAAAALAPRQAKLHVRANEGLERGARCRLGPAVE